MNKKAIIIFSMFLILLSACGIGSAVKVTRLSTNPADQLNASIWSNYVVWEDARNGGSDVYLTDVAKKVQTRITKGVDAKNPMVSGTKIVWSDNRNGNWDIYQYDIKTKKTARITTNKADQTNPSLYGNMIVWEDTRNGGHDIYLIDLAAKKETRITKNGESIDPNIYGNKIVYSSSNQDEDFGPKQGIFAYDLKTKKTTQITGSCWARALSMYNNDVLIQDYYDYEYYYVDNIASKKEIDLPYAGYTSIYGNKVVYASYSEYDDWSKNNYDIYMTQF